MLDHFRIVEDLSDRPILGLLSAVAMFRRPIQDFPTNLSLLHTLTTEED